jgi:hypothetical protein
MREILETGEYFNRDLIRNNRICAGAIFFLQVVSTFFHAFFTRPAPSLPSVLELPDLLFPTATALLLLGTPPLTQPSPSSSVPSKTASGPPSASPSSSSPSPSSCSPS